jgi:2-oxoglutarate dehydrogenase E2 component (dihydrolipoamide succinyltransferase)
MLPITVPELGLAPTSPLLVSCWLVDIGEAVVEGDRIVELQSNEITIDVASPATGRLSKIEMGRSKKVRVGDTLGWIEPDGDDGE